MKLQHHQNSAFIIARNERLQHPEEVATHHRAAPLLGTV